MEEGANPRRFNWRVLQSGQLPLRPDKNINIQAEHRCTTILIWPQDTEPAVDNTVIVDPCFTEAGYKLAEAQLAELNTSFAVVNKMFVTHPHGDHLPYLPSQAADIRFQRLSIRQNPQADGLNALLCPGHHPLLLALAFRAVDNLIVWAVGDAVLDEEWLRDWGYYWPNGYSAAEVVDTWRSVAKIIAGADLIVPGHGEAIRVTAGLVQNLINSFPNAPYADRCPEITARLQARLDELAS